jgi:outer membrane biosynthesis protein TonB
MNGLALRFSWGEHRLHSEVLRPGRGAFTVGTAHGVDFPIADVAGAERFTLVPSGDIHTVRFARGMSGSLWRGDEERSLKDAVMRGEALPDGDGWAVTLGARDAVRLELGSIAVEALPVPVPSAVQGDLLEAIDLRMLNILAAVVVLAGTAIVAAVTRESEGYRDDDRAGPTRMLARFVASVAEPKASAPSKAAPEKKPAREGAAPPQKVAERTPASKGRDPKEVAQKLGQFINTVLKGDGSPDPLGQPIRGIAKAGVAANGITGFSLKGDGNGGGPGETLRIGGIERPGRGHGPADAEGEGTLCKAGSDCKHKPAPELGPPEVSVVGMDKELIRQVIHAHKSEVRYCYELELTRNPKLEGKTAVRFLISHTGAVTVSNVVESTVRSSQLESCVAGRVRTWQFPRPPGGGTVVVTYPFVFRANGM